MTTYLADIEANGLLELDMKGGEVKVREATVIHVLVMKNLRTGEVKRYRKNEREDTIAEGWAKLQRADVVIGHNFIQYDWPLLCRLEGEPVRRPKIFDTLVGARLLWPDAKSHPYGGNSLDLLSVAAGGARKMAFKGSWDHWSQEMEDYCVGDVEAEGDIFLWMRPRLKPYGVAFRIETRIATIIAAQQANGVRIDIEQGEALIERMELVRAEALDKLQAAFPPTSTVMKSRWWLGPDGIEYDTKKSAPLEARKDGEWGEFKKKEHPFECTTQHLARRFKEKYDWDCPVTKKENPSIKEEVLLALDFPEAEWAYHHNMAKMRLGHLMDWTIRARECRTPGVIHPGINTNGAVTGRMTHSQPNQTAAPKVQTDDKTGEPLMEWAGRWGWEMRSLWNPAHEGWWQWGADASGLEYRMLADAMWRWDGGAYAKIILTGDIHEHNRQAGSLLTRPQSKETGYAFLYGSGVESLGITIGTHPSLSPDQRRGYSKRLRTEKGRKAIGSSFRRNIRAGLPALGKLIDHCIHAADQYGYLTLYDGRRAPSRMSYAALNTLLQGNGAIVMKLALILFVWAVEKGYGKASIEYGRDYALMLNAHDEFQGEARTQELADFCGRTAVWAIEEAGRRLKCKIELNGEYRVGKSWAETH